MTTIAQLISKLQTFPQNAEVECLKEQDGFFTVVKQFLDPLILRT